MPKTKKNEYPEIDDIREDLNSLKDNVVELTRHIKKDGEFQTHKLQDMAVDQIDTLKDVGLRQYKIMEKRVKRKPVQAIAIAFAAGLISSMLLGGRQS